jgi:hypothetical protein
MAALAYELPPVATPKQVLPFLSQFGAFPCSPRWLAYTRAGRCDGPPYHKISRNRVVYRRDEVLNWVRERVGSDPWKHDGIEV